MKGLFIPEITAEMFRNGCLEAIEALMTEGEIYDIEYESWIPCSERLPELTQYEKDIGAYSWKESDFVLVSTKNGLVGMASLEEDADGKTWMSDDDFVMQDIDSFTDVTAWMPLPEPYKADMRGEE